MYSLEYATAVIMPGFNNVRRMEPAKPQDNLHDSLGPPYRYVKKESTSLHHTKTEHALMRNSVDLLGLGGTLLVYARVHSPVRHGQWIAMS
jgi:hypothetical protein